MEMRAFSWRRAGVPPMAPAQRFLLDNLFRSRLFLSAPQWISPQERDSGSPSLDTWVWRICQAQHKTWRVFNSIKMMDYWEQSFKVTFKETIRWNSLSPFRSSHFLSFPHSHKHKQHHNLPHTLSSPRPLQKLNPVPPQLPLTRCKHTGLLQTVNHQHYQHQNHPAGLITTAVLIIREVFYFFLFIYHHIWLLKKWHESELELQPKQSDSQHIKRGGRRPGQQVKHRKALCSITACDGWF